MQSAMAGAIKAERVDKSKTDWPMAPEERREHRTEQQLTAHTINQELSQQTIDAIHHPQA